MVNQTKRAAKKMVEAGQDFDSIAKELCVTPGTVRKWATDGDWRPQRGNELTFYDYQVRRAAELIRQGFPREEVSWIVKLDPVIVGGLNPKNIAPVPRGPRDSPKVVTLTATDFTRSGQAEVWG